MLIMINPKDETFEFKKNGRMLAKHEEVDT